MRQREISFQLGQVPAETQGCARSWGLCSHICQSRAVGQGEGGWLDNPSQDTYVTSLRIVLMNMRKKSHPPDPR